MLEIGTFTGYSALSMAAAMPADGRIDTLDIEPKHAEVAQRYFDRSPDGGKITLHLGPALETIETLDGEFDFVFIDADKENYDAYFEAVLPRLSEGGLIAIDNTLWSGTRARPARRDDEADRGAERQARRRRPRRRRPADGARRRHARSAAADRDTSERDSRLSGPCACSSPAARSPTPAVSTPSCPEAVRLLMIKSDGSVLVHADSGGYRPSNWMTPPTVIEESDELIVVRKRAGKTEDRLEIRIAEVLSDQEHEMDEVAGLEKDGVEKHLQEALAAAPEWLEAELRLDRREWMTEIGPVDLMCRDCDDGWVAVEIKRVGTIEAVEQLTRYLGFIRADPAKAGCRGILAAQSFKPQAVTLAESRGLACVEVDLAVLRGEREPELTLFG